MLIVSSVVIETQHLIELILPLNLAIFDLKNHFPFNLFDSFIKCVCKAGYVLYVISAYVFN